MVNKTTNYEQFKFRSDNREKIDKNHVNKLVQSIKARNLLDLRLILVNGMMEIIDGQHRLLAAKELGVEIYYEKKLEANGEDILLLNISKSWNSQDYMNYYCQNNFEEYIKLKNFMKRSNLKLQVALNLCNGNSRYNYEDYKNGKFIFKDYSYDKDLDICWETIHYIKKMNGHSKYTSSIRFWKALLTLVTHYNFDPIRWRVNMHKMIERFCCKATGEDYRKMFMDVYNWRSNEKINILEKEF